MLAYLLRISTNIDGGLADERQHPYVYHRRAFEHGNIEGQMGI